MTSQSATDQENGTPMLMRYTESRTAQVNEQVQSKWKTIVVVTELFCGYRFLVILRCVV